MEEKPAIKHLVISGGQAWGFYAIGAIRKAISERFIDMSHIESIYCTSIGSIIATIISIHIDMDVIIKYLVERPWMDFFLQRSHSFVDTIDYNGLYSKNILVDFFLPLFGSKDISIDITMEEFYQLTGKDIHIFTTEFNEFVSVDISHKTHGDWKLVDAVYCSICVPFLISPIIISENGAHKCYVDGGLTNNYPIGPCIKDHPDIDTDTIFGILLGVEKNGGCGRVIPDMNFLDFTSTVVAKLVKRMICIDMSIKIKHELVFYEPENPGESAMNIIKHTSKRKEIIDEGAEKMTLYLTK